ncbi:hypothetical protein L7F22_042756 [Adiantum nelumboides]|nr:hypothetical protein [Adiantum nelumboides]
MKASIKQIYPPPTNLVSEFWREKYEKDAKKYWELFYKRNSNKFFKDRHYLHKEWGKYFEKVAPPANAKLQGASSERPVILEIGCGVGNTLFPLLDTYPNVFVHACDFSSRAVNLVKAHKNYKESHIHVFVLDVTTEDLTLCVPVQSVDVATLVFSLSAMSPEKMPPVLQNIKRILKPEGHVLIRDYAFGDFAQDQQHSDLQERFVEAFRSAEFRSAVIAFRQQRSDLQQQSATAFRFAAKECGNSIIRDLQQ